MPLFLDDPTDDLPDQGEVHDAADRRDQARRAAEDTNWCGICGGVDPSGSGECDDCWAADDVAYRRVIDQ